MKAFFYPIVFYPIFLVFSLLSGTVIADEPVKENSVKEISVKDVQKHVNDKAANVAIIDANNSEARTDAGVVPGAILLTSYNQYAITELPKYKNTTLVFYCYNSYCQASHAAAVRAIGAGYKDARVMKAGIVGWNAANKKS